MEMNDSTAREVFANPALSVIGEAGAGSGKTTSLILRYLRCLSTCKYPEQVLMLTFTNKAALEMRTRVQMVLRVAESGEDYDAHMEDHIQSARKVLELDKKHEWGILHNPGRIKIMTFDKLNATLAQRLPLQSGMATLGRIEDNPEKLYKQAVYSLYEHLNTLPFEDELVQAFGLVLSHSQNRLDDLAGVLADLLGRREQWIASIVEYDHDRAENSLQEHINEKLVGISDRIPFEILSRAYQLLVDSTGDNNINTWVTESSSVAGLDITTLGHYQRIANSLLTNSGTIKKRVTKNDGFPPKKSFTEGFKELLEDAQNTDGLEQALNDLCRLPAATYPEDLSRFTDAFRIVLVNLLSHLKIVFSQSGKVDFPEISLAANAAMLNSGEEGVSDVLLEEDQKVNHILVDEMQDTSVSQYKLLSTLTSGWDGDDGRTISFVGDSQQNIYQWRAADLGIFIDLKDRQRHNQCDLSIAELTTNFRSHPSIVEWVNSVFSDIMPEAADRDTGAVPYIKALPVSKDDNNDFGVKVIPFDLNTPNTESQCVVETVQYLQENHPNESISILVRSRPCLADILPALKEAGIEYQSHDLDRAIDTPAVRDALSLIRALYHPADSSEWLGLLRAPFVGFSWEEIVALGAQSANVTYREAITTAFEQGREGIDPVKLNKIGSALAYLRENEDQFYSIADSIEYMWNRLYGFAVCNKQEIRDVKSLFALLRDYISQDDVFDLSGFISAASKLRATPSAAGVVISTIHAAKGLDWDNVLMVGLNHPPRGYEAPIMHHRKIGDEYLIVPSPKNKSECNDMQAIFDYISHIEAESKRNEELRLFYVQATRAKNRLYLFAGGAYSEKEDSYLPKKRSIIDVIWNHVSGEFVTGNVFGEDDASVSKEKDPAISPVAPQLDANWSPGDAGIYFEPRVSRTVLPSESVIKSDSLHQSYGDSPHERIIGTMYHSIIERIANDGLGNWTTDRIFSQRQSIEAGMRRLGMPESNVEDATGTVMQLAADTLTSSTGQWILTDRQFAKNEMHINGFIDDRWVSAIIDRMFIDGDEQWIIDYKTSLKTQTKDIEAHIAEERELYAPQMHRYKALCDRLHPNLQTKLVLYFPAVDRLEVIN